VYIDTSVIGGGFDEEFSDTSNALIEKARNGGIELLLSDLLAAELAMAPEHVYSLYTSLFGEKAESLRSSEESERIRDLYIQRGVVGPGSLKDAHHVALATVEHADLIVS